MSKLKSVKQEDEKQIRKTPLEDGKNFIEGFLGELKRQKKYVIFYCGFQMLERADFLEKHLSKFLEEFDGKKMGDVKKEKKNCEEFVSEFESELKDRDKEMLDNLKDAKDALLIYKKKSDGINLGEELVVWDAKNAAYLDMIRVVNGEEGLKMIYLNMIDIAEQILISNNITI